MRLDSGACRLNYIVSGRWLLPPQNSIAGAACLLEMDQETTPTSCSCGKGERLQQALEQLYKTMRWCSSRQVMVDLSAGRYQTSQNPLDVGTFLLSLCHDSAPFVCEDLTASLREKNDVVISFDEKMARLALENAISNAIAHGDRKSITLRAEFHENGKPLKRLLSATQQ